MSSFLTVKDLEQECQRLIKAGHGDKNILISNDDEGNGYHILMYSFMEKQKDIKAADFYGDIKDLADTVSDKSLKGIVLLG